jgi:hypothetical protein
MLDAEARPTEEPDADFAEVEPSGFSRIADLRRIREEWEKLKADC